MNYITKFPSRCALFTATLFALLPQISYSQAEVQAFVKLPQHTPQEVTTGAATRIGHASPEQKVRVVLGVQPPHMPEEEQFLVQLQDPKSPQFHHYLNPEEWNARFGPSAEDEQSVVNWAQANGFKVTNRYGNRLLVDLEATVAVAENAFGVTINNYQLGATAFYSNDRDPVIPASLQGVVHAIAGLNSLHTVRPSIHGSKPIDSASYVPGPVVSTGVSAAADAPAKSSALHPDASPNSISGYYDPTDLTPSTGYNYAALYNQGHCCNPLNNPGSSPKETSIAIATVGDFSTSDISTFASNFGFAFNVQRVNVDGTPTCCEDETTLDVEWSLAMANSHGSTVNTALIKVFIGANTNNSTLTDVYNAILNDNTTRVMSSSWTCSELDCYDAPTMTVDHAIFNQMIGEGWTLVAASGDEGATANCMTTGISYPASDPDIVAAGGTAFYSSTMEVGWSGGTSVGSCEASDGGSTGGCSAFFAAPSYQTNQACGANSRSVPDLALNASPNTAQIYFFGGSWQGIAGTSIVAPELAGFFAQENAYLLYLGTIVGNTCTSTGTSPCAPLGNPNPAIYAEALNKTAPHYPFYDVLSGCNSNDVTTVHKLNYYCAGPGYDEVTGWGSANMLQLAWAINDYVAGDRGAPVVNFSGPGQNQYFNTDQIVSWTITDTSKNGHPANGVAGFTAGWDSIPSDVTSEPTPGSGNSFYSGPANPNATAGSLHLNAAGQGCHSATVQAWDNSGQTAGSSTYTVCYDTTAPSTVASLQGTLVSGTYTSAVTVTLTATDNLSGIASTLYSINGASTKTYSGPFTVAANGSYTITFHSVDKAGNVEGTESVSFSISGVQTGGGGLLFIPITPCRIADTRPSQGFTGAYGPPELAGNSTRNFTIAGVCGIPSNASAYALNVTVVPDGNLRWLTAWPNGQSQPNVSTLNSDGRVKANAAIVPAGTGGAISVYVTDSTNLVLDVDGYFVPAGTAGGLAFYPLTPCRLVDTRGPAGSLGAPYLFAGSLRTFALLSNTNSCSSSIPSNAQAFSLNFAALPRTSSLGYLTTWPAGQNRPNASTLNATTGAFTANAAILPATASGGAISVFASDDTDLLVDIDGYFAAPGGSGALTLYTVSPCRVLDTRGANGTGSPFTNQIAVSVAGSCGVPAAAQAYVLNATVVPPNPLLYLTLWPNGQTQPVVSTLNANDGATTSNMAIVPTTNGSIDAFASSSTQLILDIASYFAP